MVHCFIILAVYMVSLSIKICRVHTGNLDTLVKLTKILFSQLINLYIAEHKGTLLNMYCVLSITSTNTALDLHTIFANQVTYKLCAFQLNQLTDTKVRYVNSLCGHIRDLHIIPCLIKSEIIDSIVQDNSWIIDHFLVRIVRESIFLKWYNSWCVVSVIWFHRINQGSQWDCNKYSVSHKLYLKIDTNFFLADTSETRVVYLPCRKSCFWSVRPSYGEIWK